MIRQDIKLIEDMIKVMEVEDKGEAVSTFPHQCHYYYSTTISCYSILLLVVISFNFGNHIIYCYCYF